MTDTILAAHHGQVTTRTPNGVHKQAVRGDGDDRYEARVAGIHREAMMLEHLEGTGVAPRLIDVGDDWSLQEDLGDTDMPDGETFRRACTRLLYGIRQAGVHHGDLTFGNMVLRDGRAWAVDWQDASWVGEEPHLQRNYRPDATFVWRTLAGHMGGGETVADVPRVVRRWQVVRDHLPEGAHTLVDLGCFQGDFPAMAAAEGMSAAGVDQGGFRSGENSIEIAQRLWSSMVEPYFFQANILDWPLMRPDVVLLFSTWPYLLQDCRHGGAGPLTRAQGWQFILDTAKRCRVLFFETQLYGDGPGPEWLKTDDDVRDALEGIGLTAEAIGTFPVTGRPASRTVWKVTA